MTVGWVRRSSGYDDRPGATVRRVRRSAGYDGPWRVMLDYHLHLWPHGERDTEPTLDQLGDYCERAAAAGVSEIALTEHLFRFVQADAVLGGWWDDDPDPVLRHSAATYWAEHAHADLDTYVETVLAAKRAGLPVVLGLEVDYYPDRMDKVAVLLAGYPFDVLLGSVHWIGAWLFDVLGEAAVAAEWDRREVADVWDAYTRALEELAATGVCDVLAHPDLVKVAGHRPEDGSGAGADRVGDGSGADVGGGGSGADVGRSGSGAGRSGAGGGVPSVLDECHARMAEAAARSGMAAEVSSAGWRKPAAEAYPAPALLTRFRAAGVPVTTASDAHSLPTVAHRSADLRALVTAAGYETLTAFRARCPHPVEI